MGLRLGLGGSSGCRLRSLGSQGMRSGTLAVPRAEVRGYAHNTHAAGQCLWARVTALPGAVCPSLSACAHLSLSCVGPREGLCAHLVGPESEGVWVRLGARVPSSLSIGTTPTLKCLPVST